MLNSEEWQKRVVAEGVMLCPKCESVDVTFGACAVGAFTIHQEYVCESCQHMFKGLFVLTGEYPA
ncbi:hypothetical protein PQQ87_08540 [Paraburkholderia nemoris]|jgi:transposase-like protein|uniref:hypothetical protein n=1 Tax=Paraburkholderia nemoris TaxID=2793076 RepID=UPI0038BD11EB